MMEAEIIQPKIQFKVVSLSVGNTDLKLEEALNSGYKIDTDANVNGFVILFKYE